MDTVAQTAGRIADLERQVAQARRENTRLRAVLERRERELVATRAAARIRALPCHLALVTA
jgi:hypothetical protein